jgi:RHS repeat-associated protein
LVTNLTSDLRGRLTSRDVGGEVTGYEYDGVGQLTKVTLPDGSFLSYTYDAAHRLTQIQDNLGNKIVYTLDAMGNPTREEVLDPASVLTRKREHEYNTLNRLIKDIGGVNPASEITQYGYDTQGNLTTLTDSFSKLTTHEYDQLNRLKKMIDPAASGSGQGGSTQYAYDGLDQLAQVTDPRSLATSYALDGLGNLTQQVSPDSGTTTGGYDAAGNPTSQTDARGVVATFSYDALNRLTQAVYTPPGSSGIQPVTLAYSYDQGTYGKGRLTGFTDPSGTSAYTWNQQGRLTAEVRTIASVQYTTGYGYDGTGRLNRITYPSGRTLDYGFDALGRIQQIDTTANSVTLPVVSAVTYQPFGGVTGFTFGNATPYSRSYDLNGNVSAYTLGNLSRTLAHDAAARITGFTHNNPIYDQTFGYDNLARLTSWTGNSTSRAFGYDAVHNRTSETIGANNYSYSYPASSNRLTSTTGPIARSYTYDATGSPTADGAHTFSYDGRGRLTHSTWGALSADYQLNALGQRVYKAPSNAPATVFHFDQDGRLIAESNAAGQVQREYLYLNGMPVAVALGTAQTDLYFLHPDHLDTPRVVTNSANTIVWRWDSADPFGGALASEDPDGNGQSFTLNLRFPGQYFDQETQLHHNYFRDYDPQTGRFIQSDPIGLLGGVNSYAYVGGRPVTRVDPAGLDSTLITTYNGSDWGTHSALIIGETTLYDPAGGYQGNQPGESIRGEDGIFRGPKEWDRPSYEQYHKDDGDRITYTRIPTTPAQEIELRKRAEAEGDKRGFSCGRSVAEVIRGICNIEPSWWDRFPGNLHRKVKDACAEGKK